MHSHCRSALSLAAITVAAGLAALPAAAQTTTTFVSGPSWNTTDASGTSLGAAQYVVLNSQYPTVQPPNATNYGVVTPSPVWTADISSIPGAYWIWAPGITGATPNASLAQYSFSQQFFLAGAPETGALSIAADDYASVFVNGTQVGSIGSISDINAAFESQSALTTFNLAPYLTSGLNTILVDAQNGPASFAGGPLNEPDSVNEAGVVFGGSITSAAVPEASTTVSFGLLLALGGAFIVVKRKAIRKAGA
jgi:hypothetical protein